MRLTSRKTVGKTGVRVFSDPGAGMQGNFRVVCGTVWRGGGGPRRVYTFIAPGQGHVRETGVWAAQSGMPGRVG